MAGVFYVTREEVKNALDFSATAYSDRLVDLQIDAASRRIDGRMHRIFRPETATRTWDWPNIQTHWPWRLWFDEGGKDHVEALSVISLTSGGVTIPPANYKLYPDEPPYDRLELDVSTSSVFSATSTWQQTIQATIQWGYNLDTIPAGTVPAGGVASSGTGINLGVPGYRGVGSILLIDSEYMLVTGRSNASTGTTIQGNLTANLTNQLVPVVDPTQYVAGETLLVDAERMRVLDSAGTNLIVNRATDGTTLAAHTSGATIYAQRQLTVVRGALGSTPAAHTQGTAVLEHDPPSLIREIALVESVAKLLRIPAGFPVPISRRGQAGASANLPGSIPSDLGDLWEDAETTYRRKARSRVV